MVSCEIGVASRALRGGISGGEVKVKDEGLAGLARWE